MLELKILRAENKRVIEGLRKRNLPSDQLALVDKIIEADDERKKVQAELDKRQAQLNQLAREIGDLYKAARTDQAEILKSEVAAIKSDSAGLSARLDLLKADIENMLLQLPNVPASAVPAGTSPEDNMVYRISERALPEMAPECLFHWDLAKKYDLFDMELGAKISGSGFVLYRHRGAKLQRALINYFLDEAVAAGYEEIQAPLLVNGETARGTGQLPDKEGQMYCVEKDGLYLIPTAEVPITNIFRDVILKESDFPIKLCGYTPCFRREAGSYGAHVKGLNRVHQFDKIEIVRIEKPEHSYAVLEEMVNYVEGLLQKLELPYRIMRLCGGDMGFASAMTYDFEVYSAVQKRWLEVSSVSNFETFQTNRMKLRYKNKQGETVLAHTLNGSALALARIVAALLENHQTDSGINIPAVLHPYTGFEAIN